MKDQSLASPDYSGPVWLVWEAWQDKYHPAKIYGSLPASHGATSRWKTVLELTGDDRYLPLEELAAKYPPLNHTDETCQRKSTP